MPHCSLTTLREELLKIESKVVRTTRHSGVPDVARCGAPATTPRTILDRTQTSRRAMAMTG